VSTGLATETLAFETVSGEDGLESLRDAWDPLVRCMSRPCPFLLFGWLSEWWRHYGAGARLDVHVARRGTRLVGALPLVAKPFGGMVVARFPGAELSPLVDLLVADAEGSRIARGLLELSAEAGYDAVDVFGLPRDSRLAAAAGPRLKLIERIEAPVLDLTRGWEETYRAKTTSKRRTFHRRCRRLLSELGRLEVTVARDVDDLTRALEEAFALHELRWRGRPDRSEFATPRGKPFHRAAIRALAGVDVPRIVTLRIDGRPIAFHYYFALCGRMYVHRLAFDPSFGRFSPGLLNTFDAIETACAEGLETVEFLGGAEQYKLSLADRLEPLYEGFGLTGSLPGRAFCRVSMARVRMRRRLKSFSTLRRIYFEGLRPAREAAGWFRRPGARPGTDA
jgi:CelD/BcsL family acetyltransferase involved in cellulose biosynthesis